MIAVVHRTLHNSSSSLTLQVHACATQLTSTLNFSFFHFYVVVARALVDRFSSQNRILRLKTVDMVRNSIDISNSACVHVDDSDKKERREVKWMWRTKVNEMLVATMSIGGLFATPFPFFLYFKFVYDGIQYSRFQQEGNTRARAHKYNDNNDTMLVAHWIINYVLWCTRRKMALASDKVPSVAFNWRPMRQKSIASAWILFCSMQLKMRMRFLTFRIVRILRIREEFTIIYHAKLMECWEDE